MRLSLLAASCSILLGSLAIACSGGSSASTPKSESDLSNEDDTSSEPTGTETTPENSSADQAPASTPSSDGNTTSDAGTTAPTPTEPNPSTPDPSAGACITGSVPETESNDALASANSIPAQTGTFCGQISSDSDVDFVKFTLPASTKSLSLNVNSTSGAIKLEPTADGEAFSLSGNFPFKPGKEYVIKISSTGGALSYRVGLGIN